MPKKTIDEVLKSIHYTPPKQILEDVDLNVPVVYELAELTPDACTNSVIEQLCRRVELGIKTYGCTVTENDLTRLEWIQHAQEEALDLAVYLERLKMEILKENYNGNSSHT